MEQLRAVGLVPAAEDAAGLIVDLRARPRRANGPMVPDTHQHWREPPQPSDEQIASVVATDAGGRPGRRRLADEQQTHQAVRAAAGRREQPDRGVDRLRRRGGHAVATG